MRFISAVIFSVIFMCVGIYAQQPVSLPDYTKWVKKLGHSEAYLYRGKNIQLHDQYYILEQQTSRQLILVYYGPEDSNKEWFAIHMTLDSSGLKGSLFERIDSVWSFIQNLSQEDLNDMAMIFKSRYYLVEYTKKIIK